MGSALAAGVAVSDFFSIKLYTLINQDGYEVRITNYGATVTYILIPGSSRISSSDMAVWRAI